MNADSAVAGTGSAGHESSGRSASQLAVGLRHVHRTRLKPTRDKLELLTNVVQPVERIEEAFPWHLEHMIDALCHQRVGQNAASQPRAMRDLRARANSIVAKLPRLLSLRIQESKPVRHLRPDADRSCSDRPPVSRQGAITASSGEVTQVVEPRVAIGRWVYLRSGNREMLPHGRSDRRAMDPTALGRRPRRNSWRAHQRTGTSVA